MAWAGEVVVSRVGSKPTYRGSNPCRPVEDEGEYEDKEIPGEDHVGFVVGFCLGSMGARLAPFAAGR